MCSACGAFTGPISNSQVICVICVSSQSHQFLCNASVDMREVYVASQACDGFMQQGPDCVKKGFPRIASTPDTAPTVLEKIMYYSNSSLEILLQTQVEYWSSDLWPDLSFGPKYFKIMLM